MTRLYAQAFREFGVELLCSRRPGARPTFARALTIAGCLRREGNLRSRASAAEIEQACDAAL